MIPTRASALLALIALAAVGIAAPPSFAQTWQEEAILVESDHPYASNLAGLSYRIRRPGASHMRLYFERLEVEYQWDFVDLLDAAGRRVERLTGDKASFWTKTVEGDQIEIRLTSDSSYAGYGFKATALASLGLAPPPVSRVEALVSGRALRQDDEVKISVHGQPGDHVELEIRAFDELGRALAGFSFDPRVRTATGETPITVESVAPDRIRLHAGATPVDRVPVHVYSAERPELGFKFAVTIGAASPPAVRVDTILAFKDGARLGSTDVVSLAIHDMPGDHVDLEVRGYNRASRRPVAGFAFAPRLRALGGIVPATSEDLGAGRIRIHAGPTPVLAVPIQIYDASRPELNVRFLISVDGPEPGPEVAAIGIFVPSPDGESFRLVQPGEVIEMTVHEMGNDHLAFRVLALDPTGHEIDPDTTDIGVSTNVVAWYGAIEASCHHEFVFHAGVLPSEGIRVIALDRTNPRIQAVLLIRTVRPLPGHGHGDDHDHGDDHGHDHGAAPEPPRQWVQIGETYAVPGWARARKHYIDCIYQNANGISPIHQVRVLPRQDLLVEYARLDFADGSMETILSNLRVRAFEGVVIDVPEASRSKSVAKVTVRVRAEGGTEVLCYLLTNG